MDDRRLRSPEVPARIFHHAAHAGTRGLSDVAAAVRMPISLVNMHRFDHHPSEYPERGFDPAQFELRTRYFADRFHHQDMNSTWRCSPHETWSTQNRDALDFRYAVTHLTDEIQDSYRVGTLLGRLRHMPHAMFFTDDVIPRLLNDTPVALLRRGEHVDIRNVMMASRGAFNLGSEYIANLVTRRVRQAKRAHRLEVARILFAYPRLSPYKALRAACGIANAGSIRICFHAWQCLVSEWARTTFGVEQKWEAECVSPHKTRKRRPIEDFERGLRRPLAPIGTMARQYGRWRFSAYYLLRIHRIFLNWKSVLAENGLRTLLTNFSALVSAPPAPCPASQLLGWLGQRRPVAPGRWGPYTLRYRHFDSPRHPTPWHATGDGSLHRASRLTIRRWMRKSFRASTLAFDLHINTDEFVDGRTVVGSLVRWSRESAPDLKSLVDNFLALSNHCPRMMMAVIGEGEEFVTPTPYDCLCNLFILRHTYVGLGFWLRLKIPPGQVPSAISGIIGEITAEALHHLLLLTNVLVGRTRWQTIRAEDDRTIWEERGSSRNIFGGFFAQVTDVRDDCVAPLVTFMWNHRAEVMSTAQMVAFFGTDSLAHKLFPLPCIDPSQVFFGLRQHLWVKSNLSSLLSIAVHSHLGSASALDDAYEGVRIALEAVPWFRQGELVLFKGDDGLWMDLVKGILSEGWYIRWAEWWHRRDLCVTTPSVLSPDRLDTSSPIWLKTMMNLVGEPGFHKGFSLGWPILRFSKNSHVREDCDRED